MRKQSPRLQEDTCEFLRKVVTYLGHIITINGVRAEERKAKTVKKFPFVITD